MILERCDERPEPAVVDFGVVVQEDEIFARRDSSAEIAAPREAEVLFECQLLVDARVKERSVIR